MANSPEKLHQCGTAEKRKRAVHGLGALGRVRKELMAHRMPQAMRRLAYEKVPGAAKVGARDTSGIAQPLPPGASGGAGARR